MSKYRNAKLGQLARVFKALSHPHRLQIFLRLTPQAQSKAVYKTNGKYCSCVGELGRDLGIVPSTVSHHINELREAGLIRMERCGQRIECWIEPGILHELTAFLSLQKGE